MGLFTSFLMCTSFRVDDSLSSIFISVSTSYLLLAISMILLHHLLPSLNLLLPVLTLPFSYILPYFFPTTFLCSHISRNRATFFTFCFIKDFKSRMYKTRQDLRYPRSIGYSHTYFKLDIVMAIRHTAS